MLSRTVLGFVVSAGLMAAGCGGDDGPSPSAACQELVEVVCHQVYSCVSGLPGTEAACVTQAAQEAGCPNATRDNFCENPNLKYQANEADTCIEQIANLSCALVESSDEDDFSDVAPACGRVCVEA
jgi:hypothetical protein